MLVLVNGIFAGAEIAVVSIRKTRLDELLVQKSRGARAVARLRNDPERFLATVQIGITVIGAAAAAFGGSSMARDLEPVLRPIVGDHAGSAAFALVVGLISFLSLVLGELVPKSLALRIGERYALLVAQPLWLLSRLARPLVWLLTTTSNLVLKAFGDATNFVESRVSPGEIQQLVEDAADTGSVHPSVGAIASRAIDFAEVTAGQIMIPRAKVLGVRLDVPRPELRRIILEEGKSRMLVYGETLDDVRGYVMLRDAVAVMEEGSLLTLEDALRDPIVAPTSMLCVELLAEMRRRRVQLAIVVDEGGSLVGIATLEDVLEELVGEIEGENEPERAPAFVRTPAGAIEAQGDAQVHELNRELDLELPESDRFTTVAGLVLDIAGKIPKAGDLLTLDDGTKIEILVATERRVVRVAIRPAPKAPPEV